MRLRGYWASTPREVPFDSGVHPSVPAVHIGSFSKCFLGHRCARPGAGDTGKNKAQRGTQRGDRELRVIGAPGRGRPRAAGHREG